MNEFLSIRPSIRSGLVCRADSDVKTLKVNYLSEGYIIVLYSTVVTTSKIELIICCPQITHFSPLSSSFRTGFI